MIIISVCIERTSVNNLFFILDRFNRADAITGFKKKFVKIGLSTTKGDGFNPDLCFAPQIFSGAHAYRAKTSKSMATTQGRGFLSNTKISMA